MTPSGSPEPSWADIEITLRLQDALALMDIRPLDHLVVGTEGGERWQNGGNCHQSQAIHRVACFDFVMLRGLVLHNPF
ncbi:JAB domain-containing protein [Aeromonas salmonicida]